MYYVELMRGRRVLTWYTILVFGLVAIMVLSVIAHRPSIQDAGPIPLGEVFLACVIGAWVVATIVSTSLVSESTTLPIIWTRPVSRERIAWSFVAIDLATILLGYVVLIAAALLCIALLGLIGYVHVNTSAAGSFVLAFGSAVLWYALTLAASSRLGGHGVRVASLRWVAFLVIGGVWAAPVPAPIHAVLTVLNYLNPIAYISGVAVGAHAQPAAHPIPTAQTTRIALEWGIAAIVAVAAVRLWSTKEA